MTVEPVNRGQALADALEELDWLVRKVRGRGDDALDVINGELGHLREDNERLRGVLAVIEVGKPEDAAGFARAALDASSIEGQ